MRCPELALDAPWRDLYASLITMASLEIEVPMSAKVQIVQQIPPSDLVHRVVDKMNAYIEPASEHSFHLQEQERAARSGVNPNIILVQLVVYLLGYILLTRHP